MKTCSLIKNKDLIFRSLTNVGPSVKQIDMIIQYLNDNKIYVDINKVYDNSYFTINWISLIGYIVCSIFIKFSKKNELV